MDTKSKKIVSKAVEILRTEPNGVRYSNLIRRIKEQLQDIPENTIHGTIWRLEKDKLTKEIYKPSRGLFRHISFKDIETTTTIESSQTRKIKEEDFYESFKNWLIGVDECTKAKVLGGKVFKDKCLKGLEDSALK